MGKPALSLDFGDVAYNVGGDFLVADYQEMYDTVLALMEDGQMYAQMSALARERAAYLMDTEGHMRRLLDQVMAQAAFF